ncbi:MAG: HEPN domain-containing protein [Methanophagales archaeon]|nr:HEPN domain-containing protein [Methanophagales archaeon]
MTFKDEKIYSGMKELVKKSLAILNRSGFEFKHKHIEDSNIEVDLKNIPPISFLLNDKISRQIYSNSKIEEIEKTKEFTYTFDLVNKMVLSHSESKKHDDIQLPGLGLDAPSPEVENALKKQQFRTDISLFLIAYCNLKKDLEFDEAIFNGLYKRFEEKLYGKNYIMALCPLKKFYLETDELVLDDGIKIRRISEEELSFIKEMAGNAVKKPDDIKFTIEYTYDETEFRRPEDADEWTWSAWQNATAICEKKFIEIIALLRLFKDGDFHNPLENFQVPFWANAGQGIHFNLCDRRIPEDGNYILKRAEAEDFTEFYRKSLRLTDDRRMFIALERFNLAYEKKRFEDNIIDYVIGFEALFGTMRNRIGMQIKLKSGFLVGDSKEEITKIYKFMHDVYKLRSKIVHGDEIKIPMKIGKKDYSDYQLRPDIIEIFRKIIRCFFDEGRTEDRKETFAIIEDELKSGENKDKSGEEMIEVILDRAERKGVNLSMNRVVLTDPED